MYGTNERQTNIQLRALRELSANGIQSKVTILCMQRGSVVTYCRQAKEVLQANKLGLTGAVDTAWADAGLNVVVKVDNIDTPGDVLRSSVGALVPAPRLDRGVLENLPKVKNAPAMKGLPVSTVNRSSSEI